MANKIITYKNAVKNNFMTIELDVDRTKRFQNNIVGN